MSRRRSTPLSHEVRVMLHALLAALPAALAALGFLWIEPHSAKVRWTLTLVCVGAWGALENRPGSDGLPLSVWLRSSRPPELTVRSLAVCKDATSQHLAHAVAVRRALALFDRALR